MEILYLLLTVGICYFIADRALRIIEQRRGALLPHRDVVFFLMLLVLLLSAVALVRSFPA